MPVFSDKDQCFRGDSDVAYRTMTSFLLPLRAGRWHFSRRRLLSMTLLGSPLPVRSRSPQQAMTAALSCGGMTCPLSPPPWGSLKTKETHHDEQRNSPESDLDQFTGSENWYRHGLNRNVTFTDGAKYVADEGGAYWLLDAIAICQRMRSALPPKDSRSGNSR